MTPTITDEPARELPDVRSGRLPARYAEQIHRRFLDRLRPLMVPGVAILDLGGGRSPTIARDLRPSKCRYVGLDISARELEAARPGAYTDIAVSDVSSRVPFVDEFDIVISWQVLEHVKPLDHALENIRAALVPGGTLLAQFSGTFSVFGLLARVLPHPIRAALMSRLLGHPPELKFPTNYHRCYETALRHMLSQWEDVTILPFYRGATYFTPLPLLQQGYLRYESWVERRHWHNFATHYLLDAKRRA